MDFYFSFLAKEFRHFYIPIPLASFVLSIVIFIETSIIFRTPKVVQLPFVVRNIPVMVVKLRKYDASFQRKNAWDVRFMPFYFITIHLKVM